MTEEEMKHECPICKHILFERFVHETIYLIGMTTVMGWPADPITKEFMDSTVNACRKYLKSKDEK